MGSGHVSSSLIRKVSRTARSCSLYRLVLAIALVAISGCALTEEHINVAYTAQPSSAKVVGAEQVIVAVQLQDQRTTPDHVGHKTNGYGMEMAKIRADNDIPTTVQQAIETELTNRGFQIGPGKVQVHATLQKFENKFELGWFSGTARSNLILGIVVNNPGGVTIFTKYVNGEGINEGVQITSGENAKLALEAALKDAMGKLFDDQAFINALLEAAKPPNKA